MAPTHNCLATNPRVCRESRVMSTKPHAGYTRPFQVVDQRTETRPRAAALQAIVFCSITICDFAPLLRSGTPGGRFGLRGLGGTRAGRQRPPPLFGLLNLVERENVQPGDPGGWRRHRWPEPGEQPFRPVAAGGAEP